MRAISILCVLATHMLPLGPKSLRLNEASGQLGMSLFFTLSGFLITQQLWTRRHIPAFLVRRLFRIVPLAWLYATLVLVFVVGSDAAVWLAHAGFAMNYVHSAMTSDTSHFWSLCVEVHFYLAIALWMALTRFRGFWALPIVWLALVVARLVIAPGGTIETHLRVDEIFAGATLALVQLGRLGKRARPFIEAVPFPLLVALLLVASHPDAGPIQAFRGMFASLTVGHALFLSRTGRYQWLGHRALRYVADTSYALYVLHPLTMHGWLGSGPTEVKYAKRILSFALTFAGAHLSTFFFERWFQDAGRRVASRLERGGAARPAGP